MRLEELRIGNWIQVGDSERYQPTQVEELTRNTINRFIPDVISPVPLTTEWLENWGFEKRKEAFMEFYKKEFKDREVEVSYIRGKLDYVYYELDALTHVRYVHQLQNLYFALTGEEIS